MLHPWPHRCPGCGFPHEHCVCALIPRVPCRARIVVVRHIAERKKASNTGGLTALVLGCPRIDHGDPGPPTDLSPILGDRPRVLAPHGSTELTEPPSAIVVLDGTWGQARRMRARIPPLRDVPAWTLPDAPARDRMRRPHLPDGLSTMEAVATALELLGEPEPARALRSLYDELVRRWLTLRLGHGYAG
jgi:DTW domain-containing protein YfiP